VTTLRIAWVCGPGLPTRNALLVDAKMRFVVASYEPPFQAVHETDVARAIMFALSEDLPGTYNVCADDTVANPEELLGQRRVTMSLDRARRVLPRTARMGFSVDASAIGVLMYPQVMANDALRTRGFTFEHTTAEALAAAAEARREWVALGKLRFRPRRVALVTGTLGAALLGRAVNKRRAGRGATPEKA
jgi:nucleoside-diphosphate-sugar epimerase